MVESGKKQEAKKSFFEVRAPMTSTKISLYAASAQELHGKTIMLDLTRSLRGKNFVLKMAVFVRELQKVWKILNFLVN